MSQEKEFPPGYEAALDQATAALIDNGWIEKCNGQDCPDPLCTGYSITREGMWMVILSCATTFMKAKGSPQDDALQLAWFFLIRLVNPEWDTEVLDKFEL